MTKGPPSVHGHFQKVGENRKQIAKYVEWARETAAKCRTDAERATVLTTLLRLTEGLA